MSDVQITSIIFRENLYHLDNCMSNITSSKIWNVQTQKANIVIKQVQYSTNFKIIDCSRKLTRKTKMGQKVKSVLKQKDNQTELHLHLLSCVFEAKNSKEWP